MIESDIERNLVAYFKSLAIEGLDVTGLWQPSVFSRGEERISPATLVVAVPSFNYDTFTVCDVSTDISFTVVARVDLCDGDILKYIDKIASSLEKWNLTTDCDTLEVFNTDEFTAAGVNVQGGAMPDLDQIKKIWTVQFKLTLRGSILH